MATGTLNFPIQSAVPPDATAGNMPPAIRVVKGTEADPKKFFMAADFDPTTDNHLFWQFRMPFNYAGNPNVRLAWFASALVGTARWGVRFAAITPGGGTDTPIEKPWATATTTGDTADSGESNFMVATPLLNPSVDSAAPGDLMWMHVYRDADGTSGTDDLAVVATLFNVIFDYTMA